MMLAVRLPLKSTSWETCREGGTSGWWVRKAASFGSNWKAHPCRACWAQKRMNSETWFWSKDLWIMRPARYLLRHLACFVQVCWFWMCFEAFGSWMGRMPSSIAVEVHRLSLCLLFLVFVSRLFRFMGRLKTDRHLFMTFSNRELKFLFTFEMISASMEYLKVRLKRPNRPVQNVQIPKSVKKSSRQFCPISSLFFVKR